MDEAAVQALVGQSTGVQEMYDVVDKETIRRHVRCIPDQDPRHWDEELAKLTDEGGVQFVL